MVSILDKEADTLVKKTAEELQKKIKQPDWANIVKTGISRERPPEQKDWWYLRSASVLRRIYIDGPVGVSKLRSYYGGRQRRGHKPAHFKKGSGIQEPVDSLPGRETSAVVLLLDFFSPSHLQGTRTPSFEFFQLLFERHLVLPV